MSKKLFVGGLSWDTTDPGLMEAFSAFGTVSEAKVITDRETGRSRGFGFVTFEADGDAETAMQAMDGATLDGRRIRVDMAQERERAGRGGGDRGGGDRGGGDRGGGDRGGGDRGGGDRGGGDRGGGDRGDRGRDRGGGRGRR